MGFGNLITNNMLRIEPIYNGKSTEITAYKVVDEKNILQFTGDRKSCETYMEEKKPKIFLELNGKLVNITDLPKEQYEQFLEAMFKLRMAYIAIERG